jgi:hypothetical protein
MKYKNIKKNSSVDTYQDNLFLAVSDMFVDMVADAGIKKTEARRLIIRDVNEIIDANIKQTQTGTTTPASSWLTSVLIKEFD